MNKEVIKEIDEIVKHYSPIDTKDDINWYYMSKEHTLSENLIREMKDKVYWKRCRRCGKDYYV